MCLTSEYVADDTYDLYDVRTPNEKIMSYRKFDKNDCHINIMVLEAGKQLRFSLK